MKKILFLFTMMAVVAACGPRSAESEEVQDETQMEVVFATIDFRVEGMTCTGCESTINNALTGLEGVVWAESSHLDSLTTVQFDPGKVNVEQLQDAIRGTGYEVTGFSFVQEEEMEGDIVEEAEEDPTEPVE